MNSSDLALRDIRLMVMGILGIKEPKRNQSIEDDMKNTSLKNLSFKHGELEEWYKAGMPSPPEKFLKELRNGN